MADKPTTLFGFPVAESESVGLGEIVFAKPPRIRLEIVSIENGVITAKVAEFEQPTKLGTILIGKAGDLPNA